MASQKIPGEPVEFDPIPKAHCLCILFEPSFRRVAKRKAHMFVSWIRFLSDSIWFCAHMIMKKAKIWFRAHILSNQQNAPWEARTPDLEVNSLTL